jgi:hypothetical protein
MFIEKDEICINLDYIIEFERQYAIINFYIKHVEDFYDKELEKKIGKDQVKRIFDVEVRKIYESFSFQNEYEAQKAYKKILYDLSNGEKLCYI